MSNIAGATTLKITSAEFYVPVVTLSSKDNKNLTKQLNEGFKRPVYWGECKSKIEPKNLDNSNPTRFYLDASFQGVTKFYVLPFDDSHTVAGNNITNGANIV